MFAILSGLLVIVALTAIITYPKNESADKPIESGHIPAHICQIRKFNLTISEDIWPTLFAPTEFEIGYCEGSCPFPSNFGDEYPKPKSPEVRVIMDAFELNHPIESPLGLPRACCVPISFKPVPVIVWENGVLHNRSVTDLLVDACGCR